MTSLHPNQQEPETDSSYASFWGEGRNGAALDEEVLDAPFDLDREQRSVLEAEVLLWRIRWSRTRQA